MLPARSGLLPVFLVPSSAVMTSCSPCLDSACPTALSAGCDTSDKREPVSRCANVGSPSQTDCTCGRGLEQLQPLQSRSAPGGYFCLHQPPGGYLCLYQPTSGYMCLHQPHVDTCVYINPWWIHMSTSTPGGYFCLHQPPGGYFCLH